METQTQSLAIAKEILNQIRCLDRSALMAWGARNFIALPESKEFQGGVRFTVNGLTHQGFVTVELRYADDYTVSFISKAGELVHSVERVYCDMLVDIIDYVEGK
jgi:hypothetical protein